MCVQIASDGLKGRVIEVSLADLQKVRAAGRLLGGGVERGQGGRSEGRGRWERHRRVGEGESKGYVSEAAERRQGRGLLTSRAAAWVGRGSNLPR